jgi:predicted Zn-dependent protease
MRSSLTYGAIALTAAFLLTVALTGCEDMEEAVRIGQQILRENPDLIEDEEERQTVSSGLRAVEAMIGDIDTGEEIAMGQSLTVRAFPAFGRPHPDRDLQRYVSRVGTLVALQSERPSLPYSFAVVQNPDPTALALPGGFVLVSTGLLQELHSESELAAILGHEISHVAQKHGLEIVLRDQRISRLLDFAGRLDEDSEEYREFIEKSYEKLAHQGYDLRYETTADVAGTRYAYHAGYHPEGLLPFLHRSAESRGQLTFETSTSHPSPRRRLNAIRSHLSGLARYSHYPKLDDRYQKEALARLQ